MKRIAVINDLSSFGRCSLTAAIPVISVMGNEACPLPTAVLSNQTGYEDYFCDDYSEKMNEFPDRWKKITKTFDGIFSGYIANEKQIDFISSFIDSFSDEHTIILVDPVMGDDGRLYASHNKKICDGVYELTKKADIITPNLTELCILTGTDYTKLSALPFKELIKEVRRMSESLISGRLSVVITTGINYEDNISTAVLAEDVFDCITTKRLGGSFSGTGDIFASVVISSILNGISPVNAVKKAMDFISKSIGKTLEHEYDRNDGIDFQTFLKEL